MGPQQYNSEAAMGDANEFSWNDDDCVVVPQVDAVAVYSNPSADIVIRQRHPMGEDDHVVIVPRKHFKSFMTALRDEFKRSKP
jgi:hypothetical protein